MSLYHHVRVLLSRMPSPSPCDGGHFVPLSHHTQGIPAFAAEDTAEENCFQTLNIPRATGSTVDKSVLLNESRLYLITDFGAVSEGDPIQNTKAINAAIQAASEAGGGTVFECLTESPMHQVYNELAQKILAISIDAD